MAYPKLQRYEIRGEIGRGGMGVVYRARNSALGKTVAVKVLHPHLCADSAFASRFQAEAETLASLSSEHIVEVYDLLETDGTYCIVMEYVEGTPLSEIILQQERLEPGRAAEIARQVCAALEHAHAAGIIHRDVKPSNILVQPDGKVKLVDFSVARNLARRTVTTTFLGTPEYMAPEQIQGNAVDGRADIYSLGCVLYEMLTGHPPFEDAQAITVAYRQVNDPPPALPGDIPPALAAVVERCLEKNPEHRYADASALSRGLAEAAAQPSTAPRPTGSPETHPLLPPLAPVSGPPLASAPTLAGRLQAGITPAAAPLPPAAANAAGKGATPVAKGTSTGGYFPLLTLAALLLGPLFVLAITNTDHSHPTMPGPPYMVGDAPPRIAPGQSSAVGADTVRLIGTLPDLRQAPRHLAMAPDGFLVAATLPQNDSEVGVWGPELNRLLRLLKPGTAVTALVFSPDNRTLALGTADGAIQLWDATSGKLKRSIARLRAAVTALTFSPDGNTVAAGSGTTTDGKPPAVKIWDVQTGATRFRRECPMGVVALSFAPDGESIAAGVDNYPDPGKLYVWSTSTSRCVQISCAERTWIDSITFSHNGHVLASAGGSQSQEAPQGMARIGDHFGSGSAAGEATAEADLWDPETGAHLATLKSGNPPIDRIRFSWDDNALYVAAGNSFPGMWDLNHLSAGPQPMESALHCPSSDVTFYDDPTVLVTTGVGHPLQLWRVTQ